MVIKRNFAYVLYLAVLVGISGCMTTGYSTARNPNLVKKFDVTIIEIEKQNIYNALGVSLVGPLASVEHVGEKVTFLDATGAKVSIVQPKSNLYELHPAQKAVYIVDRGQVWVQPADYPLPPEFNTPASKPAPVVPVAAPTVAPVAPVAVVPAPQPTLVSKTEIKSPAAQSSGQNASATQRLRELNALYKEGLIEKSDYETKKQAILKDM